MREQTWRENPCLSSSKSLLILMETSTSTLIADTRKSDRTNFRCGPSNSMTLLSLFFLCGTLMLIRFIVRSTVVYSIARTTKKNFIGTLFHQKSEAARNFLQKCQSRAASSIKNAALLVLLVPRTSSCLLFFSPQTTLHAAVYPNDKKKEKFFRNSEIQKFSPRRMTYLYLISCVFRLYAFSCHRPFSLLSTLFEKRSKKSSEPNRTNERKHNFIKYSSA